MSPYRDDLPARLPHWLAAADRAGLAAVLRDALDASPAVTADPSAQPLHPVVAVQLADVLTELQVAHARDTVWPESGKRVRQAVGLAADVVPVRLSAGEVACVLDLPGLPAHLRSVLGLASPAR